MGRARPNLLLQVLDMSFDAFLIYDPAGSEGCCTLCALDVGKMRTGGAIGLQQLLSLWLQWHPESNRHGACPRVLLGGDHRLQHRNFSHDTYQHGFYLLRILGTQAGLTESVSQFTFLLLEQCNPHQDFVPTPQHSATIAAFSPKNK
jgi:hypothetical protein